MDFTGYENIPKLEPCPFCGSRNVIPFLHAGQPYPKGRIGCLNCGGWGPPVAREPGDTEQMYQSRVSAEWNRQPGSDAIAVCRMVVFEVEDTFIDPEEMSPEFIAVWKAAKNVIAKVKEVRHGEN